MTHKPVAKSKYSYLGKVSLCFVFSSSLSNLITIHSQLLSSILQNRACVEKHMHTANAFVLFVPFHSFCCISFCSIPGFTNTNVQVLK